MYQCYWQSVKSSEAFSERTKFIHLWRWKLSKNMTQPPNNLSWTSCSRQALLRFRSPRDLLASLKKICSTGPRPVPRTEIAQPDSFRKRKRNVNREEREGEWKKRTYIRIYQVDRTFEDDETDKIKENARATKTNWIRSKPLSSVD